MRHEVILKKVVLKKILLGMGIICLVFLFFFTLEAAQLKLKVIGENAIIRDAPDIRGKELGKAPRNRVLDAEEKIGEWYKVTFETQGGILQIGYIHSGYVKEMSEEELAQEPTIPPFYEESQDEIIADIDNKIQNIKNELVRYGQDPAEVVEALRPVIARSFRIDDAERRKELGAEIYYWLAQAYEKQGKKNLAFKEIRNMFEVDQDIAEDWLQKEGDRNIAELFNLAKQHFNGLIPEFSLVIKTNPQGAVIRINGEVLGPSPDVYKSKEPEFEIEIIKEGYKTEKEMFFMAKAQNEKIYDLIKSGRNIEIGSFPSGAKVFLDGKDTGEVTDCTLQNVLFGSREIKIEKKNYVEWTGNIQLEEGEGNYEIYRHLTVGTYEWEVSWGGGATNIFNSPKGIAFDSSGNFYVVDEGKKKIQKFNTDARLLDKKWKVGGSGLPSLRAPSGIAIDKRNNIYVTDAQKHTLIKFNDSGQYISHQGGKGGSGPDKFNNPMGVAIDSHIDIFVADKLNNCIKIFSNVLKYKGTIGKEGSTKGKLRLPIALAFNQKDELFVLDGQGIQKFSPQRELLTSWGMISLKDKDYEMKNPKGIYIDNYDFIYIVDYGTHRIFKFDENGNFLIGWGNSGTGRGQFNMPSALSIDSKGNVFVVDKGNNRIQQFKVPSQ